MTEKKIQMTDDAGHFWLDGKLFKIKRYMRGSREDLMKGIHKAEYVEVNPEEYDARVGNLANEIVSHPGVDLMDILRDALYDLPLEHLSRVEKLLAEEKKKPKPEVKTKKGARGTCVELRVGGKFAMELRA